jgi:hypothetical protein
MYSGAMLLGRIGDAVQAARNMRTMSTAFSGLWNAEARYLSGSWRPAMEAKVRALTKKHPRNRASYRRQANAIIAQWKRALKNRGGAIRRKN